MIVIFLLTMLVVVIPALHVLNSRYIQRIALFIGTSQLAFLAFAGIINNELSGSISNGLNHAVSFSFNIVIQKMLLFFFSI